MDTPWQRFAEDRDSLVILAGALLVCVALLALRRDLDVSSREVPDDWEEREVASILPDWRAGLVGTHTFNHADGVTVVDGLQYRWAT